MHIVDDYNWTQDHRTRRRFDSVVVSTVRRGRRRSRRARLVARAGRNKARLAQAWIEIHREELLANWQLAVNGEEVFRIDPLK